VEVRGIFFAVMAAAAIYVDDEAACAAAMHEDREARSGCQGMMTMAVAVAVYVDDKATSTVVECARIEKLDPAA
jgi:hypothetical protein